MSIHFHPLVIADLQRETEQCVSIAFAVPEALSDVFRFQAGQNITLRHYVDGQEIRRSYSICSTPDEKELRIAVKEVEGGVFSSFANRQLRIGDTVDVLPPTGRFSIETNPNAGRCYLAFAAGSGITPVFSLIKNILATEPLSEVSLVYGNKSRDTIIFREAVEGLKNRYPQRFRVLHVLSRERLDLPVQQGRINADKCRELGKGWIDYSQIDHVFLCGPEEMIFDLRDFLLQEKLSPTAIHFELFHSPGQKTNAGTLSSTGAGNTTKATRASSPASAPATVSIRLDGRTINFDLAYDGNSILDAALAAGADLPYACKGGVCATCRARLVEGEVSMDQNYALVPEELDAGFILTCQSHPRSPAVTIDFDQK